MTAMALVAAATRPGHHLATRGTGVIHLYRGPLTPSNRYVPRSGSPVCNTRTRQLRVCDALPVARALAAKAPTQRPCRRCMACLVPRSGQATPTRIEALAAWGHLTAAQVMVLTHLAATADDVAWVTWVGLLVLGVAGCRVDVTGPDGRRHPSLHELLAVARSRTGVNAEKEAARRAREAEDATAYMDREKARRHQDHLDKEARIERLGIELAQPYRPRRTA